MSYFWYNQNETYIKIPSVEEVSGVTYYNIEVFVTCDYHWKVQRRYKEFYELHGQLIQNHGISKDILPAKKVIRNKCPIFIEARRQGLEEYLRKTLLYLRRTMPTIFVEFLHFHLYDIYFLLVDLTAKLVADECLSLPKNSYKLTPLELYALSECLRKPVQMLDVDNRLDLSYILDLCSQLTTLNIEAVTLNYLQSNIVPNKLHFELLAFKTLKCLTLKNVSLDCIDSLGNLRTTVQKLCVHNTNTTSIGQILQCDVIHKSSIEGSPMWTAMETLNLSNNNLVQIDRTINLAPNLQTLILNDNKISTISNLNELSKLSQVSLSNNIISICPQLHTKVGNILTLNLSQNNISSLSGFSKLYSLENLDLSCNKIVDIEEIRNIGELPCLQNLLLTGNNISTAVDYRIIVLDYFNERASDICLDNERGSQCELDKVSILRALRIVKEGRTPNLYSH